MKIAKLNTVRRKSSKDWHGLANVQQVWGFVTSCSSGFFLFLDLYHQQQISAKGFLGRIDKVQEPVLILFFPEAEIQLSLMSNILKQESEVRFFVRFSKEKSFGLYF